MHPRRSHNPRFDLRRTSSPKRWSCAASSAKAKQDDVAAVAVKLGQIYRPLYVDEATARLSQAVQTDRPFVERLTHFWTNHFAVSIDKVAVLGIAGAFEREAIRPNVLGNFTDLLLAVERHPAMLLYLDNHLSVGLNSRAAQAVGRRRSKSNVPRQLGLNENLAREILELHTLGVNGGYTQQDVTTFAEVITGWSIGGDSGRAPKRLRGDDGEPGKFLFRPTIHEPGAKTVLGKRYAESDEKQGEAVLRDVAKMPATATFIATKLARHFIADDPPPGAVEALAKSFTKSRGDLPSVYRTLIEPEGRMVAAAHEVQDADGFHLLHVPGTRPAGRYESTRTRVLRSAGPAHVHARLAGGLA